MLDFNIQALTHTDVSIPYNILCRHLSLGKTVSFSSNLPSVISHAKHEHKLSSSKVVL